MKSFTFILAGVALLAAGISSGASAEVSELRVGKQYGLPYMQFVIMEDQKLIEKHAAKEGLNELKVVWATMGGPAALNDGIISGAIDLAGAWACRTSSRCGRRHAATSAFVRSQP